MRKYYKENDLEMMRNLDVLGPHKYESRFQYAISLSLCIDWWMSVLRAPERLDGCS
jgi:hypothetical protein